MTPLRPLADPADRPAVAEFFARAADYVALETGLPPDEGTVEDFFTGAPPGGDPADGVRIGAMGPDGRLEGIAALAFGYPRVGDAYLGLLLLDPAARGQGLGRAMLGHLAALARGRGAQRMLVAVLEANPRGLAFWRREGFGPDAVFEAVERGARRHRLHRLARDL